MGNIKKKLETYAAECREGRIKEWQASALTGADLRGADLKGADLTGAILNDADLRDAHLQDTNLTGANLRGANLRGANLEGADLYRTNLTGADLTGAYLRRTDLTYTDLWGAKLKGVDFTDADLWNTKLRGAHLDGAKGYRIEGAPNPQILRYEVADLIESSPELHDQGKWGDGDPNECGTPCCVAGWACRLGGGVHGGEVESVATLLLHIDGKKMPSFSSNTKREYILEALRA